MTAALAKPPLLAHVHVEPAAADGSARVTVRLVGPKGTIMIEAIDVRPEDPGPASNGSRKLHVLRAWLDPLTEGKLPIHVRQFINFLVEQAVAAWSKAD